MCTMQDTEKPGFATDSSPVARSTERPAFTRAPSAEDEDNNEAEAQRHANVAEKAAFTRAARKDDDEDESRLTGYNDKPGFHNAMAAAANDPSSNNNDAADAPDLSYINLRGKGWVYCGKDSAGKGTWIRDCGDEIRVPYSKSRGMSPGQIAQIRRLSAEKGWPGLCAFRSGGYGMNELATQLLAQAGVPCCTDKKMVRGLSALKEAGLECWRQAQIARHDAASNSPGLNKQA